MVIPVYNGQRFILQALSSVAAQTLPPKKIIVVDDGSTDRTPEVVGNFKCIVPIDYVRKANGGLSSARNAGIARCTSEYIAFLDADDAWYPEKLAEQAKVFKNSAMQNLGIVYSRYAIIDENGYLTDKYFVLEPDPSIRGNVFSMLLTANKITGSGSGVLVKRECFQTVGDFDETLTACEDWDMWLRLAERYEFDYSSEILVKIRRHDTNMQRDKMHMLSNHLRFWEKWIPRLGAESECFVKWRMYIVNAVIADIPRIGVVSEVRRKLSEANRRKLFRKTFGSVWMHLLCVVPVIAIRVFSSRARYIWTTMSGRC